jgi:SlyX protein
MSTEDRIIELEIRIAHQDKVIAALDEVVAAFAARVEKLELQLAAVRKAGEGLDPVGPPDEPPPHY